MSIEDETFADRVDAGRRLGQHLMHLRGLHVVVRGCREAESPWLQK